MQYKKGDESEQRLGHCVFVILPNFSPSKGPDPLSSVRWSALTALLSPLAQIVFVIGFLIVLVQILLSYALRNVFFVNSHMQVYIKTPS
jgi:hypothetical protein